MMLVLMMPTAAFFDGQTKIKATKPTTRDQLLLMMMMISAVFNFFTVVVY
jgi:hypothetical protein